MVMYWFRLATTILWSHHLVRNGIAQSAYLYRLKSNELG